MNMACSVARSSVNSAMAVSGRIWLINMEGSVPIRIWVRMNCIGSTYFATCSRLSSGSTIITVSIIGHAPPTYHSHQLKSL